MRLPHLYHSTMIRKFISTVVNYGLPEDRAAPKNFLRLNKHKLPVVGMCGGVIAGISGLYEH